MVLSGLTNPTQLEFASDGSILVAQKNGKIFSFKNFADTSPTLVADLSNEVDDYWDRGCSVSPYPRTIRQAAPVRALRG